ncbi:MAG TPA: hypothetical protein VKQ36_11945 [Ktedonobacterales bacterium]|nr:hypothetical protein [Ktedonobacterales bacterium]
MSSADCFICRKHAGQEEQPPGGYLIMDDRWRVCHAPITLGGAGTLIVESQRHFLDFAEMTDDEAISLGLLLKRLYISLKQVTQAPRVYTLVTLEGAPHFHLWLTPRPADAPTRGPAFLAGEQTCTEAEALAVVEKLRTAL